MTSAAPGSGTSPRRARFLTTPTRCHGQPSPERGSRSRTLGENVEGRNLSGSGPSRWWGVYQCPHAGTGLPPARSASKLRPRRFQEAMHLGLCRFGLAILNLPFTVRSICYSPLITGLPLLDGQLRCEARARP